MCSLGNWHVVVPVLLAVGVFTTIHGRDASDCSPRDHLPCTVVKPGCMPDVSPPPEEGWPGKPTHLNVTVFMREYPGYFPLTSYPGLNITWRIPDDISYKYIKGFQMTLTFLSGPNVGIQLCRVFNLSEAKWTGADLRDKVLFYYDKIVPAVQLTTYHVQLYSLPKPAMGHDNHFATEYVVTPSAMVVNSSDSAHWVTALSFDLDTAANHVDVWFMLAPSTHGFVHYDVMLINATSTSNQWTHTKAVIVGREETGFRHVPFSEMCSGSYMVWVQPKNSWKYTSDCVCKNSDRSCAEHCVVSQSSVFTFKSNTPCHMTTTTTSTTTTAATTTTTETGGVTTSTDSPQDVQSTVTGTTSWDPRVAPLTEDSEGGLGDGSVVAIWVGCIGGVVLITVLVSLVWYRRVKSERTRDPDSPRTNGILPQGDKIENPAKAVVVRRRPRVLIVRSNDHPLHLVVVRHLAQFLRDNCAIDVSLDQSSHDEVSRADHIVIVNSLGAFRQWEAQKENAFYDGIAEDGFLAAMDAIRNHATHDKVTMVYFPYTSTHHVLSDVIPGRPYELMRYIDEVVLVIRGMHRNNAPTPAVMSGGVNHSFYHRLPGGGELAESINNMAVHVCRNPDWFDRGFFRSDSGFSSDGAGSENHCISDEVNKIIGPVDDSDDSAADDQTGDDSSMQVAQFNREYDQGGFDRGVSASNLGSVSGISI